jgi:ketosteroid isomerase-like protein
MKHVFLILLVPIVFACGSKNHDANIAIVKQYVEAVENLDYTTMESLLAENYEGYGPSAGDTIRKAAAVENWKQNVENLYQKIEYTRSQFAGVTIKEGPNAGEWVANWAELHIEYKDDQGAVTIWANSNYKVEDGKIVKSLTFYNEADVLRQLGYVFINLNEL